MTRQSNRTADDETSDPDPATLARRNVLKAVAGAVTATVALPLVSGVVAAHFHGLDKAALSIDVKPDSDGNDNNPSGKTMISVAVLQTQEFDPTSANVNYRFGAHEVVKIGGGARPVHGGHVKDVNSDGKVDLLLHFPMEDTGFDGGENVGHLHWEKGEKGAHHGLGGSDSVTIVSSCGSEQN